MMVVVPKLLYESDQSEPSCLTRLGIEIGQNHQAELVSIDQTPPRLTRCFALRQTSLEDID